MNSPQARLIDIHEQDFSFLAPTSNYKVIQWPPNRSPVSKRFWLFSICRPRSFLSKTVKNLSSQPEKTNPPVLTRWLFSANQNPKITQACNRRDHEDFQLTDIFHFTSRCSHDYTCFLHNYRYSNFLLSYWWDIVSYLLFHTLFMTSIIPVSESWYPDVCSAIHLIQDVSEL